MCIDVLALIDLLTQKHGLKIVKGNYFLQLYYRLAFPTSPNTTSPQRWHILTRSNHLFVPQFPLFWLSFILLCHAEQKKRRRKKGKTLKSTIVEFLFWRQMLYFKGNPWNIQQDCSKDKTQLFYSWFVFTSFQKQVCVKTETYNKHSKHKHWSLRMTP